MKKADKELGECITTIGNILFQKEDSEESRSWCGLIHDNFPELTKVYYSKGDFGTDDYLNTYVQVYLYEYSFKFCLKMKQFKNLTVKYCKHGFKNESTMWDKYLFHNIKLDYSPEITIKLNKFQFEYIKK